VLELKGLTRRYGDLVALDDLSCTVAEGQLFGFVGPNGAGKTTAMRIILGVLEPDTGQVLWRGQPMTDEMRQRVGYLPEDYGQTFFAGSLGFGALRRILGHLGKQVQHRRPAQKPIPLWCGSRPPSTPRAVPLRSPGVRTHWLTREIGVHTLFA
jgi:hypothetical protein